MKLYYITSKSAPSIYDSNTIYGKKVICDDCGGIKSKIDKLGAYLPTFTKKFGLIEALGGIIGSVESVDFLRNNGIIDFQTELAIVSFGKRKDVAEEYYWIKPKYELELNIEKGTGPKPICNKCGRRVWEHDTDELPYIDNPIPSKIFSVKYTWVTLCTEGFMKVAKKVPDGCYLKFEEWLYNHD